MNKKQLNELVPLILLLLGSFYLYISPSTVDKNELKEISSVLVDSPKFHDTENKSVDFNLKNYQIDFDIESSAYKSLDKEKFLSLKKGDSLVILVRKNRSWRETINSDQDCFDIYSPNKGKCLSLTEVNNRSKVSWQMILALALIYGVIILIKGSVRK